MSVVVDVADKLVERINSRQYSQVVQAVRYYQPKFNLEDIQDIKVCVVPREVEWIDLSRGTTEQRSTFQIGILKRCEPINEMIDPLIHLVHQIAMSLDDYEFMSPQSVVSEVRISTLFDSEYLERHRQFASIIELLVRTVL